MNLKESCHFLEIYVIVNSWLAETNYLDRL
jgi:hypothetical protein